MWRQIRDFDLDDMGHEEGYCLRNVRKAFRIKAKFSSALEDYKNNLAKGTLHDIKTLPLNVAVPVYLDTTSKYDHIVVADKGIFYENGKKMYLTPNLKFYGWGELINDVRVVEWIPDKTNFEIALEVIQGKWGNGTERIKRLAKAGYNYFDIQKLVNELIKKKSNEDIAKEVIQGKWGNGEERKKRLTAAGYDYNVIQKLVNEMIK